MMSRFGRLCFLAADTGVIAVAQAVLVDDLELRERRALDAGRAEEAHDRAARPEHADDLLGQGLRRRPCRGNRRDPSRGCRRYWHRRCENRVGMPPRGRRAVAAQLAIDVGEEVLDEQLAAEPLAAEGDVRADDRAQVEQDRRVLLRSVATNFGNALEATTGSSRGAGASPLRPGASARLPPHFRRSVSMDAGSTRRGRTVARSQRRRTGAAQLLARMW